MKKKSLALIFWDSARCFTNVKINNWQFLYYLYFRKILIYKLLSMLYSILIWLFVYTAKLVNWLASGTAESPPPMAWFLIFAGSPVKVYRKGKTPVLDSFVLFLAPFQKHYPYWARCWVNDPTSRNGSWLLFLWVRRIFRKFLNCFILGFSLNKFFNISVMLSDVTSFNFVVFNYYIVV